MRLLQSAGVHAQRGNLSLEVPGEQRLPEDHRQHLLRERGEHHHKGGDAEQLQHVLREGNPVCDGDGRALQEELREAPGRGDLDERAHVQEAAAGKAAHDKPQVVKPLRRPSDRLRLEGLPLGQDLSGRLRRRGGIRFYLLLPHRDGEVDPLRLLNHPRLLPHESLILHSPYHPKCQEY